MKGLVTRKCVQQLPGIRQWMRRRMAGVLFPREGLMHLVVGLMLGCGLAGLHAVLRMGQVILQNIRLGQLPFKKRVNFGGNIFCLLNVP